MRPFLPCRRRPDSLAGDLARVRRSALLARQPVSLGLALAILGGPLAGLHAAGDSAWLMPAPVARWVSSDFRQLDNQRGALQRDLASLPAMPDLETGERIGWRVFDYRTRPWRGQEWLEIDFGEAVEFDAVALLPARLALPDYPGPGYGFPVRFRVEAFSGTTRPRLVADFTAADFPNPGVLPVWLPAPGFRAQRVRLTVTQPWRLAGNLHACALAEFMVLHGPRNLATGRRSVVVRTSDSRESAPVWSRANLIDGQSPLGAPLAGHILDQAAAGHCWHSQFATNAHTVKWVQVDLGRSQPVDEVRLVPARVSQLQHRDGYSFPVRFRVEAAADADFAHPILLADYTAAPFINPGFSPVTIPAALPARYVRVTATELPHRGDGRYAFALAELQVYAQGANVARGAPVGFLDNLAASPNWRAAFLTDGERWEHRLGEWPDWLRGLSRRREVLGQLDALELEIAPLQHLLTRTVFWALGGLLVATALALLAAYYRLQFRRSREAEALRRRIAADLHDDLGSNLASIAILSEICLQARDPVPRADLAELHALARETADALRDVTWFIRPGAHAPEQFLERLRATARRLLAGIEWTFEAGHFQAAIALDAQRHLLLALKETLHNVVHHAAARQVGIRLTVAGGQFVLSVRDDGRGMDPAAITEGQGLASLRHRARLLGGATEIQSAPGQGTTVTFTGRLAPLPLPGPAPRHE